MNMMKSIRLAAGLLLFSSIANPVHAASSTIEIEAGMFGGTLYNLSYALSEVFKTDHPDIRLVPVETTGNAAGIVKASASPADRLVAGSALPLQEAVQGVSPFPRTFENFRFVAGACVHAETLITLDPQIRTLADLSGKRIGLGPQPSMQGRTMWSIMRDSIPGSDKMKPFWMNWSSLKDSMIDGSLDCMVLGVGIIPDGPWQPVSVYAEIVASRGNPHLIPFTREKLAEAADTSPQFLAQMEKGEQSMTTLKLKRLATALHVSSDYLLYGQPPFTGSAELAVELLAQMSPVDRDFLSDMLLRLNRLLRESDPNHE